MITVEEVIEIHDRVISEYGGLQGIRDRNLLESSIEGIYQSFAGYEFYPSVLDKIARLGFNIIANHPFTDGNKRTAYVCMTVLFDVNNININETKVANIDKIIIDVGSSEVDFEEFRENIYKLVEE